MLGHRNKVFTAITVFQKSMLSDLSCIYRRVYDSSKKRINVILLENNDSNSKEFNISIYK